MRSSVALILLSLPLHLFALAPGAGISEAPISTQLTPNTPASLIAPIDAQLRELRAGNVEAAYEDPTSKDFKSATTLEAFKEFISRYPILTKHKTISVKPISIQQDEAAITVVLDPNKDAVPMNYKLIRENNQWKIWHLSVTPLYSEQVTALLKDPQSMRIPIENYLEEIKNDNALKAYQQYTSSHFKKSTTLEAFRNYLIDFPVFAQHTNVRYKEPLIERGTGFIEVLLDTETTTTTVEFTMGIEDDQWKIWELHVLKQRARKEPQQEIPEEKETPAKPEQTSNKAGQTKQIKPSVDSNGPMELSTIEIGGRTNLKGQIINPTNVLRANQGDVYVNLFVRNGVLGTKIEIEIVHLESHTHIPSIATTLEQDGNVEISVIFSSPPNGWPKGHYILTAKASKGIMKTLSFTVE